MAMACTTERRSSSTTPTPNKWTDELPADLLELIVKKLAWNFVDIIRFKAVCSSWNRAARSYTSAPYHTQLPPQYPWLKLFTQRDKQQYPWPSHDHHSWCFFSLADNNVYKMDWDTSQGFGFHDRAVSFLGSSHGWLVVRENKPPRGSSIHKVVLSSDPSRNNNFVVVHGRGGDNAAAWTDLGGYPWYGNSDIVFHNNGHLFALWIDHSIKVWDFGDTCNDNIPTKIMNFQPSMDLNVIGGGSMTKDERWFVDSMGHLLLVGRESSENDSRSGAVEFYIYKLNIAAKTWEKVECLPDCALFLGRNQPAMSLSTQELPRLKENSIYEWKLQKDCDYNFDIHVEVYNLETKLVKPYYTTRVPKSASCSPPVWIVPSAFGPIREKIVLSTWLR
ncbi:hypothetical protein PRUPE_1G228100 [Prunus persica]|uniref:KIB1-4 beta-propeller domain-containing protein n=1 Tax=Prunus persica TaxID=3760 RepID=M5XJF1_PRUPE|nr:hypothetical protein PRUPE_1G228100 [Prunus persica]